MGERATATRKCSRGVTAPGEARAPVDATLTDAGILAPPRHVRDRPIRHSPRARGPFERDIPRYAAETSLSRPSPAPPSATLAGVGRYPRPSIHRVRDPPRRRAAGRRGARRRRATGRATATRTPASPRSPRLRRTPPPTPTRTTSPRRCPTRSRTNRGTPPTRTTTTSSCRAPEPTRRLSSPPKARIGLAPFFLVQFPFYRLSVT